MRNTIGTLSSKRNDIEDASAFREMSYSAGGLLVAVACSVVGLFLFIQGFLLTRKELGMRRLASSYRSKSRLTTLLASHIGIRASSNTLPLFDAIAFLHTAIVSNYN
jgi:hypothetical protein